jgi:hypothetical protein
MSPPEPDPAEPPLPAPPDAEQNDPKDVVVPLTLPEVPPIPTVTGIAVPEVKPVIVSYENPPPLPPP